MSNVINLKKNRIKELKYGAIVFGVIVFIEFLLTLPIKSIMNNSSEYNVIAMAACLNGYDWSNTILKSHYYGFTSSVIFSFVFNFPWIVNNPQVLLHALLLINVIINSICAVILYEIFLVLYRDLKGKQNYGFTALLSIAMSLFLSSQVLSKSVTNENMLVLSFYVCVLVLLKIFQNTNFKKFLVSASIISLFCIIAYATNGRGVIIITISTVVLLYCCIKNRKIWWMFAYFALLLVGYVAIKYAKHYFVGTYFNTGTLKNNDANGLIERAIDLINYSGVVLYFRLVLGWGWYFIASTYGLGILALAGAISVVTRKLKKENIPDSMFVISIIILMFIGMMSIVGVSFYHDSFIDMFSESGPLADGRVDKMIYGRYISTIKPIIIGYSFVYIMSGYIDTNVKKYYKICIISFVLWCVFFMKCISPYMVGKTYASVDIPEFVVFWIDMLKEDYKFGIVPYMGNIAVAAFTIASFFVLIVFCLRKKYRIAVIVVLIINLTLGGMYTFFMMKPRADYYSNLIDREVVEYINNIKEDNDVILVTEKNEYLYQFELADIMVCDRKVFFEKYNDGQYDYVILLNESKKVAGKITDSDVNIVEFRK